MHGDIATAKTVMYNFFNWINDYETTAEWIDSQRNCDNAILCPTELKIDNVLWEIVSVKGLAVSMVTA